MCKNTWRKKILHMLDFICCRINPCRVSIISTENTNIFIFQNCVMLFFTPFTNNSDKCKQLSSYNVVFFKNKINNNKLLSKETKNLQNRKSY